MAEQTEETLQNPTAVLPYEVCLVIFSFVPVEDLVNNTVLVCQYWKRLSDDQTTWRLICERTGRFRRQYMKSFEPDDWKKFYYINPYSRNLLKNPSLSDARPDIKIKSTETKSHILSSWHGFGNLTADEWATQFSPWEMREIGGDGIQLECPPIGCCDLPPEIGGYLTRSLPMMSFIILLWLTPDNFTCQCGRLGGGSVMHYLINFFKSNDFFYDLTFVY